MKAKLANKTIERGCLEEMVNKAFCGLWNMGVFGVRISMEGGIAEICTYSLKDQGLDNLISGALSDVRYYLSAEFTVQEVHLNGVIPCQKVTIC